MTDQACDCLQKLCEKYSKQYAKNGLDACVDASLYGEIRIVQFVRDAGKIRRSKTSKYESIPFKFCPVCGKKNPMTYARVWYDAEGKKI